LRKSMDEIVLPKFMRIGKSSVKRLWI